jgi:hypothetical protein
MLEEGRKDVSVERRGVGWSGILTGPLNGVIEEFYCIFKHVQDHIQKDWSYNKGCTAVSVK